MTNMCKEFHSWCNRVFFWSNWTENKINWSKIHVMVVERLLPQIEGLLSARHQRTEKFWGRGHWGHWPQTKPQQNHLANLQPVSCDWTFLSNASLTLNNYFFFKPHHLLQPAKTSSKWQRVLVRQKGLRQDKKQKSVQTNCPCKDKRKVSP